MVDAYDLVEPPEGKVDRTVSSIVVVDAQESFLQGCEREVEEVVVVSRGRMDTSQPGKVCVVC